VRLLEYLFPRKPATAAIAKERLQIVLAHERASRDSPEFLPRLQRELLAVVAKYVAVRDDNIRISLRRAGTASVLKINVEIPPAATPLPRAATG